MKSEKTAVSSSCLNKRARNSEIVPGFRHFERLCVRCEINNVHGRCCKYLVKSTKYIERAASTLSNQQRTWKMLQVPCQIDKVHRTCYKYVVKSTTFIVSVPVENMQRACRFQQKIPG